jgi:hypothetical protein
MALGDGGLVDSEIQAIFSPLGRLSDSLRLSVCIQRKVSPALLPPRDHQPPHLQTISPVKAGQSEDVHYKYKTYSSPPQT